MPEDLSQQKLISKTNTGFPDYLDFDKLRREGIEYLGKLSGKIWTDHNVHDPGITILEMLCYALLDLGYRTNLPAKDIFTKNPEDASAENNFFTPAQILGNNPLTITDYRKLLIDIPGVKNAWLTIARDYDVEEFCDNPNNPDFFNAGRAHTKDICCDTYLNGLYHVYIDLEKNINDLPGELKKAEMDKVRQHVRDALLAHRNFCEDFLDITVLCKLELGVCADIELEANADAEQVYLEIARVLYKFFSPAPVFYTLPQLLDKGKSIDEIFAGRPVNIKESHGFVDTEEFEKIKLRKEIHLSDVYNVLLSIKGVKRVQKLKLRRCNQPNFMEAERWKFVLPENYVPEFSISCSGFQFLRAGIPLAFDFKKYEAQIEIASQQTGKILYKNSYPNLDYEVPKGVYRKDLDQYYSIQNEFPRVYGIAEGGLADDVSDARKAKALQLKGYLLFYDQLLANFLSQLKNIRSLFAFNSSASEENHSYFINNDIGSVPDISKLLRFTFPGAQTVSDTQGTTLARPVDKKELLLLIEQNKIKQLDIESVEVYKFNSEQSANIAINQLRDDIYNGTIEYGIVEKDDECVFYYILSSSDCFALLSNRYYKDEKEARRAAESLSYIGNFTDNYRVYIDAVKHYASFDIAFNLSGYTKYLQLIAEDQNLYRKRRSDFLNHLLSRFAEQFTDFALLAYNSYSQEELLSQEIKAKEKFLSNYPALSANRGKGYDYRANGWNNDNISGFEMRFKAYSGIKDYNRNSLCNFEVARYENNYVFDIRVGNRLLFKSTETYSSKEEARDAISSLLKALRDESAYKAEFNPEEQLYRLSIAQPQKPILYASLFKTEEEVKSAGKSLKRVFSGGFSHEHVFINSYRYNPRLIDYKGDAVRILNESAASEATASSIAVKNINKINDEQLWKNPAGKESRIGKLISSSAKNANTYLDTAAFKVDIDDTIVGKPGKFTYELLDKNNSFKLTPLNEFNDEKSARADSERLLLLLADESNYRIEKNAANGKYNVVIQENEKPVAKSFIELESEIAARTVKTTIVDSVRRSSYSIQVDQFPDTWKFNYILGVDAGDEYQFESKQTYASSKEAEEAGLNFSKEVTDLELKKSGSGFEFLSAKNKKETLVLKPGIVRSAEEGQGDLETRISNALNIQQQSAALVAIKSAASLDKFIHIDEASRQGLYVYRLVDKDKLYASYSIPAFTKAEAEKLLKEVVAGKSKHHFLDIVVKGDITTKHKDAQNSSYWYHYQLRSANSITRPSDPAIEKPLVLLESTKGYESKEEAEKAFRKEYMDLLGIAVIKDNYLKTKKISTNELLIHNTDPCSSGESIAFVPKETLDYLGAYEEKSIDELIGVLKTYPIKRIYPKKDCREFHMRFKACEEESCEPEADHCADRKEESPVYYFSLFNKERNVEEWQSSSYYQTVEEAWREFQFFLLLLSYRGNYFIDCTCISRWNLERKLFETVSVYKIFIREVLAESARRFLTEAEAWGKEGVQKFIDTTQSEGSFHTYLNNRNCCYSFYIACRNIRLYHPCKYNTPDQRDRVAALLFKELEFIRKWNWEKYCSSAGNNNTLVDFEGNNIAIVQVEEAGAVNNASNYFDWYADILCRIATRGLCIENNKLYLRGKSISFLPVAGTNTDIEALKQKLTWLASYFPFTRKAVQRGGREEISYCIEIKLPGFNNDGTDDCDPKGGFCYLAWKSDCCYNNCASLMEAYRNALLLLSNFRNYKAVYDCVCNSYGIALHYTNNLTDNPNNECGYFDEQQRRILLPCENQIVAYNPQCYPDAKTACEAVERSKQLINEEGLHIVEHILLRPHCKEECNCRIPPCNNEFDECKFPYWQKPVTDPCEEERPVCFEPGYDPYSFIATVVLPAWPERFRDKEKRILFENILYREAPAHVLLRILWLAPHDFCCFEKEYKEWIKWLAKKKQCGDFSICSLREFLFFRQFECMEVPRVCLPCETNITIENPCIADKLRLIERPMTDRLNRKINELFCWPQQNCNQYRFISCENENRQDDIIRPGTIDTTVGLVRGNDTETREPLITEPEPREAEPQSPVSAAELMGKSKFINSRFARYRKALDALVGETKGLKVSSMARRFVDHPSPSVSDFKKTVQEILQEHSEKKNKLLTKKRVMALLDNITRYYLDKWAFNGKDIRELEKVKEIFEEMRKEKIDMLEMYRLWESDALKKHEPGIDMNAVRYLLTGNK